MDDIDEASVSRPRRNASRKGKASELLERMKNSKKDGKKMKYEIGELQSVYEEVDEREYTKKVVARQQDDWIVDDDGSGYIEDGREIFDDDLDEESIEKSKLEKKGKKRSRSNIEPDRKNNIRNMLVNMPLKKKKECTIKLDEDDILGDLIGEIDGKSTVNDSQSNDFNNSMSTKDYLKSLVMRPKLKADITPNNKQNNIKPLSESTNRISINNMEEKMCNTVKISSLNNEKDNDMLEMGVRTLQEEEKVNDEEIDNNKLTNSADTISQNELDMMMCDDEVFSDLKSVDEEISPTKSVNSIVKNEVYFEDFNMEFECNDELNTGFVDIDKSNLPLTQNQKGDEVFRFYCLDANEEPFTQPGSVFLFGKVWVETAKTYVSCCVVVRNISRQVFILPREKKINMATKEETNNLVSISDVYEEFNNQIANKFNIKEFKSRRVVKKYAFNKMDVPSESEYLEVRYPANCPPLPVDLKGETFSCVFGTKSSFLELLFLERGLKGPCWIDILSPETISVPISWCKMEITCSKTNNLIVVKEDEKSGLPPLTVITVNPQAIYNVKTKQTEIISIACLVDNSYYFDKKSTKLFSQHFCIMTKPSDVPWPFDMNDALKKFNKTRIEKMESERVLLNFFLTKLYKIDPDVIVGHDLFGHGIELIVDRLSYHKVPNWSRLGRLKRSQIPQRKAKLQIEKIALTGRLLCDVKLSAKELIRSRSFDLNTLCQNVLNFPEDKRPEIPDELYKSSYTSGFQLLNVLWHGLMSDCTYILRISSELNILPLALQITNIAGNVMSKTLMGGRSERNEFLLLHAFYNKGYILPDKEYKKDNKKNENFEVEQNDGKKQSKKKSSYAGGLVLEPKIGFYDDFILLMDFNSLYPSIIQEYNICFTTISISAYDADDDILDNIDKMIPEDSLELGILPTEIRNLVERRKDVKRLLKSPNLSPEIIMQYNIRQMALKLTANSMYGCLGFVNSRFYAKPLAALITAKGREILANTKKVVESHSYEVIYGDTDSVMINTKVKEYDQVHQIGRKIKNEVNKCYKQVELDIDGVFKYMLLLRKKKYAAVNLVKLPNGNLIEKQELKGLDIVRRDWSQLAAESGKNILNELLSDKSTDDKIDNVHTYLQRIKDDLKLYKTPLGLLTVTKQLTKSPELYSDIKGLPHVSVAVRLNKTATKKFRQGDTVSYIICEDGTANAATQRAYHIDELKSNLNLKIDVNYYLSSQIHPVISRLCDPIDGIDAASIARCLDLDPSLYAQKNRHSEIDEAVETIFGKSDEERYKDCRKLSFKCLNENCHTINIIESPLRKNNNGNDYPALEKCCNVDCTLSPLDYLHNIQNHLQLITREEIKIYYEGWLVCEDPICSYRTRQINSIFDGAYPICCKCHQGVMRKEVSCLQLYNQLHYFCKIFDLSKLNKKMENYIRPETKASYAIIYNQANNVLKRSKYAVVDLSNLFNGLFSFNKN